MTQEKITVRGARQHNLKNIDVDIPRDRLVVITGLSGSGKSSLAFDTIYAEGQRRYVESLSSYARQFLGLMSKPDVDQIDGLSPAISIDQKSTSHNPRSTVGTVTEIHDYLRLLYARVGLPHCPQCGKPITQQSVDQMIDIIMQWPEGSKLTLAAPLARGRKGEFQKLFADLRAQGYVRVRVDGEILDLSQPIALNKRQNHSIELVVDRLIVRPGCEKRLADSLELALHMGDGLAMTFVAEPDGGTAEHIFSQNFACPDCGVSMEELSPRMFSFNNPFGACPDCTGLGYSQHIDASLMINDETLSLRQGALLPVNRENGWYFRNLAALFAKRGYDLDMPFKDLPQQAKDEIFYGCGQEKFSVSFVDEDGDEQIWPRPWEGLVPNISRRYQETNSDFMRGEFEKYMLVSTCKTCGGARLKPESLAVTVGGKNIDELSRMTVSQAYDFIDNLRLNQREQLIGQRILKEIKDRLSFLNTVGLDYLTLSRSAVSLSGGEAQRIRLATQIGSHLTGVLYVLDEPSIGLHQRDNHKLIQALKELRDLGNTVLVVEHDEDMMRAADYLLDVGPAAGFGGGRIVAAGTPQEVMANADSITGQYLSGAKEIPVPQKRRAGNGRTVTVRGAAVNNLQDIDVTFPLGLFVCVTGVSGSGKSSLVNEILYKACARRLNRAFVTPGPHRSVEGLENLEKVIMIDQSPIGRTPRSNPATYTGVFDLIRQLFSVTPEAKARGYKPGRFSFNVRGGRCEACQGDGIIKVNMNFLPDVYVPCEVCKGKRYNRETLDVRYKDKNIADVLDMTVDEAVAFFGNIPKIKRKLSTLQQVGLGYIRLGQSATTLSGGEAQRVKLATELSRRSNGRSLYILDEPTTGLHADDIRRLLDVLNQLVEAGDTVVVIEHNLDVIKTADYLIDLGPEGGGGGGRLVAWGTPEQVAENPHSYTGQFLRRTLGAAGKGPDHE
ncbi:MAG: excinuclease ABC subunit UvrA [Firmicutes bacterium]|nr:excinuclease ABC subunit UvrA [Bacillota bacterium]